MSVYSIKRMKFILREPLQYGISDAANEYGKVWPQLIRITDITPEGCLLSNEGKFISPEIAEGYLLEAGDILLARSGSVGRSYIHTNNEKPKAFAGYLIRAKLAHEVAKKFIWYFFHSHMFWHWIDTISIQATIQNVSAEKYSNLEIPLPPLEEQREIAGFLDRETTKIAQQISLLTEIRERFSEKRAALITAAVTGQIAVS